MKRESFQSRLGFLLVSAGCAIGIGNVWRFPYVAGQNGGGLFVLLYLHVPGDHGPARADHGAGRGPGQPEERRPGLQGPGKARQQVAYPRLVRHLRLLHADDVLHHRLRLDAGLLSTSSPPAPSPRHGGRRRRGRVLRPCWQIPVEMGIWMALTVVLGFLVCSQRPAKGSGADQQVHDEPPC